MFGIGTPELIIILAIILIIFGVGKLPGIGTGLGQAITNFKKASSEIDISPEDGQQKLSSSANGQKEKA
ncbi:MAG: twin-arginine translocase TatA/TatE family subunit [Deltaproteobacteria bacterium]|nr:twin-arginine translocase TatA/TatE family subunit [Deltaproteobacteria bacterium]